jgi:hypothetical protein
MKIRNKAMISLIAGTIVLSGISYGAGVSDLDGHWAKERVSLLVAEGIINGYPDGTFKPDNAITRGEVSKVLSEYIGDRKTAEVGFKDIDEVWSADFIKHLVLANVIKGYPDGTFKPENKITRAEFVTMVYNHLSESGEMLEKSPDTSFRDVDSHWASRNISAVASAKYIKGYPDGTFRPDAFITRAEVSSVIAGMHEKRTPSIKSSWSEDHNENLEVFRAELGFKSDGNWNGVKGLENPIGVYRDNPELYEVSIALREWQTDEIKGSEKIPLVFYELLKFYFGEDADYAYEKMDDVSVTEFETKDRFVRIRDEEEKAYIYIGYKGLKKFDKWW